MEQSVNHLKSIKGYSWRVAASLLPGIVVGLYFLISTDPMPQPQDYHKFAETRLYAGIPNVGDVLTNLAFILVGTTGLWSLAQPKVMAQSFADIRERRLFQWLYIGILLTGFGSGWYHLEPDNYSLTWDRLPMAIAFMSIFAIMVTERIKPSLGIALLYPLIAIGIASVLYWIWSEHADHGDLRYYLIIQFYPMITIALMLIFLPSRYTHGNSYWVLFLFYALAKIAEIYDHQLFSYTGNMISGHNLKHLFAAAGAAWLIRMLWVRRLKGAV